jgi:hypothetical protein
VFSREHPSLVNTDVTGYLDEEVARCRFQGFGSTDVICAVRRLEEESLVGHVDFVGVVTWRVNILTRGSLWSNVRMDYKCVAKWLPYH